MASRRVLSALCTVGIGAAVLLPASPASAAAPANDELAGATVITQVPTTIVQDVTEATTSPAELDLNQQCGAPEVIGAVWFRFTVPADGDYRFDVTRSSFSAGVLVTTDAAASAVLSCGPGAVIETLTAGTTLAIMAFGDGLETPSTGTLTLEVRSAVAAPSITVTLDPRGRVDRDGNAIVSGTITCTSEDPTAVLEAAFGDVTQRVGRGSVTGDFFFAPDPRCDGTTRPWQATVVPDSGKFAGGKAAAVTVSFGCGVDSCADVEVAGTVQLARSGR